MQTGSFRLELHGIQVFRAQNHSLGKITLLATIAQLQPMHEVSFEIPPASEFFFLVALQPQLFDKAKQLDA